MGTDQNGWNAVATERVRAGARTRATIGRGDELAAMAFALDRAASNRSTALLVTGPAGIGKSRLLDQLPTLSNGSGARIRLYRCHQGMANPVEMLRDDLGSAGSYGDLSEAQASLAAGPEIVKSARSAELASLASTISASAREGQSIIAFDDFHEAPPVLIELLDLLVQTMRARPGTPLLLVIASRPTPSGERTTDLLRTVRSYEGCVDVEVPPLNSAEEAELVRRLVPNASPTFLGMIRAASGGNPLRSEAAVRTVLDRGVSPSVRVEDGATTQPVRIAMHGTDPVARWLESFPKPLTELLQICAVLGGDFAASEVRAAVAQSQRSTSGVGSEHSVSGQDLDEQLDEAVRLHVLSTDGHRLWFAHPSYAELVALATPSVTRRRLHARLASMMLATSDQSTPERAWLAIGRHLVDAGDAVAGLDADTALAFLNAGSAAFGMGHWFEAARFLAMALDLSEGCGHLSDEQRADAAFRCGTAHYFNHDLDNTVDVMTKAIHLAEQLGDERRQALALTVRLRAINNMHPDAYRTVTDLSETLAFADKTSDPDLAAITLEACAEACISTGDLDHGRQLAERAQHAARSGSDQTTKAVCAYAVGYVDLVAARPRRALPALLDACRHAQGCGDWYVESALDSRLAMALIATGELDAAEDAAERAVAQASAHSEHSGVAVGAVALASAALVRGDLALTRRYLEEAKLATARSAYRSSDLFLPTVEILLELHEGRLDAAAAALRHWKSMPSPLRRAYGALIHAHGSSYAVPKEERRPLQWRSNQVSVAATLVELQAALLNGDVDRLRELDVHCSQLAEHETTFAGMALLSVDRVIGEVHAALGRHEEADSLLKRTTDHLRRIGAKTELAACLYASADLAAQTASQAPDIARQRAAEASHLAKQIGISSIASAARALATSGADQMTAVRSRGGRWTVILVTDIVGSTSISADLGDVAYHDLIMAHHEIVRRTCSDFDGTEISDSGDGLYLWFHRTEDAVEAAREVQRVVAARRATGPRLGVKIALSGGEPLFRGDRPYGLVVNRAFRVVDEAEIGQILVDDPVGAALDSDQIERYLEPRPLRGIGPHRIGVLHRSRHIGSRTSNA